MRKQYERRGRSKKKASNRIRNSEVEINLISFTVEYLFIHDNDDDDDDSKKWNQPSLKTQNLLNGIVFSFSRITSDDELHHDVIKENLFLEKRIEKISFSSSCSNILSSFPSIY